MSLYVLNGLIGIFRSLPSKPYRQHSDECSDSCEELSILGIHKFPSRDAEDILSVKSSLQFVVDVWHENADPTCKCNGPLSIDEYLGAVPMKPETYPDQDIIVVQIGIYTASQNK
uniref:Uncharacterized protein n=1 Tax=Glossina palpalis gambiensis TaxID=67801 RepID=A0A1B0C1W2_9MUSC